MLRYAHAHPFTHPLTSRDPLHADGRAAYRVSFVDDAFEAVRVADAGALDVAWWHDGWRVAILGDTDTLTLLDGATHVPVARIPLPGRCEAACLGRAPLATLLADADAVPPGAQPGATDLRAPWTLASDVAFLKHAAYTLSLDARMGAHVAPYHRLLAGVVRALDEALGEGRLDAHVAAACVHDAVMGFKTRTFEAQEGGQQPPHPVSDLDALCAPLGPVDMAPDPCADGPADLDPLLDKLTQRGWPALEDGPVDALRDLLAFCKAHVQVPRTRARRPPTRTTAHGCRCASCPPCTWTRAPSWRAWDTWTRSTPWAWAARPRGCPTSSPCWRTTATRRYAGGCPDARTGTRGCACAGGPLGDHQDLAGAKGGPL